MHFTNIASLLLLGASNAVMESPVSHIQIDPKLVKAVASGTDLYPGKNATDSGIQKRSCTGCGIYLCSGRDFTDNCYWGCYPPRETIDIDPAWVKQISSVGPDDGCFVTIGTPAYDACQAFTYPGGNVGNNECRGNVGNFYSGYL